MAGFPADPDKLRVGIAFGADIGLDPTTLTYQNVSASGAVKPRVTISRGRIGNAAITQPSTVTMGMKNPGGVFSPRNISGPHYGQLRHNTPMLVDLDPGTGTYVTRGQGYISDWNPQWDGPDIHDRIALEASGVMRRLGQGEDVRSAMRRTVLGASAATPIGYWPCEDSEGATSVASGLSGGRSMSGNALPHFTSSSIVGSAGAIDLMQVDATPVSEDGITAVMDLPSTLGFQVEYATQVDGGAATALLKLLTNDWARAVGVSADIADGLPHHVALQFTQSGADVNVDVYHDGTFSSTSTITGVTIGSTLQVSLIGLPLVTGTALIAQIVVYAFADIGSPTTRATAAAGYVGEQAGARFARLCVEENIPVNVTSGLSEPMGPQLPGTTMSLLRECEDADEATMLERRDGRLGFDPVNSRYDQVVFLTLNYSQLAALVPSDDDRDLHNNITVSRIGGSSGTYKLATGPLSVDTATGAGDYPDGASRSLATDAQAIHHASWLVALGTQDEQRFVIGLDLRANPGLVSSWLGCDIGSRIVINDPPAQHTGPAPLDLIIEGYTETLDAVEWSVVIYALPYRPYEVLQIQTGTGNRSRIAAEDGGSTTNATYGPTVTALSVTSATVRWIDSATYGSQFPIVIEIAGEPMTCTAITGTGLTQAFTVTRGLYGVAKTLPSGSAVQIFRPPAIAL